MCINRHGCKLQLFFFLVVSSLEYSQWSYKSRISPVRSQVNKTLNGSSPWGRWTKRKIPRIPCAHRQIVQDFHFRPPPPSSPRDGRSETVLYLHRGFLYVLSVSNLTLRAIYYWYSDDSLEASKIFLWEKRSKVRKFRKRPIVSLDIGSTYSTPQVRQWPYDREEKCSAWRTVAYWKTHSESNKE